MNDLTTADSNNTPAQRSDAATYMNLFPDTRERCAPASPWADNERPAYLVHLKGLIEELQKKAKVAEPVTLQTRRPDLLQLKLNNRNIRKSLAKIDIVLEVLERHAGVARKGLPSAVAEGVYKGNVPFHNAWEAIKATLAMKQLPLWDLLYSVNMGMPAFSFDAATLNAQHNAALLSSGFSPQLRTLLLQPASAAKDFYKTQFHIPATSPKGNLDTTYQLTQALGLTRRELRRLLAVSALGKHNTSVTRSPYVISQTVAEASSKAYGAAFINGGGAPLYLVEAAETQKADAPSNGAKKTAKKTITIAGISTQHIDRLQRILRLQRALGLPPDEADALVIAALRAERQRPAQYQLTVSTLRALGLFRHLQQKYQVQPLQFAALLHEIPCHGTERQLSFFDSVFAPRHDSEGQKLADVLVLDDQPFDPNATTGEDALTVKRLGLALRVDPLVLRAILDTVTAEQELDKPQRSLAVVSACYRLATLTRLFGTSQLDGWILLKLLMKQSPVYQQQLAGCPSLGAQPQPLQDAQKAELFTQVVKQLRAHAPADWPSAGLPDGPEGPEGPDEWSHPSDVEDDPSEAQDVDAHFTQLIALNDAEKVQIFNLVTDRLNLLADLPLPDLVDVLADKLNQLDEPTKAELVEHVAATLNLPLTLAVNGQVVDALALRLSALPQDTKASIASIASAAVVATQPQADIVDAIAGVMATMEWFAQQNVNALDMAVLLHDGPLEESGLKTLFGLYASKAKPASGKPDLRQELSTALGLPSKEHLLPLLHWVAVDEEVLVNRIDAVHQEVQKSKGKRQPLECFTADDRAQWLTLQRYSRAVSLFGIGHAALDQIMPHHFNLGAIPRPLDLTTLHQLGGYTTLLGGLATDKHEPDLLRYLKQVRTPLDAPGKAKAWADLEALLGHDQGGLAKLGIPLPTTLHALARVLQLTQLTSRQGLSVDGLLVIGALTASTDDNAFEQAAIALRQSCSSQQCQTLDAQLKLAWRDALMQWMLVHWAAPHKDLKRIKSPEALADYLLIDLQVSHEPLTTRVLSAIASLQRYLQQIHSRLEDGYGDKAIPQAMRDEWDDFSCSFERWKLRKDAQNEPQNFIDPSRRTRTSSAFAELETQLAQGKCTPDEIQTALLGYLSTFEHVSNIQPLSAYASGTDPLSDTYHFIGKSNVEPPEYYWRTLDMKQRDADNAPSMMAWGEWEEFTLAMSGEMVKGPLPVDKDIKNKIKEKRKESPTKEKTAETLAEELLELEKKADDERTEVDLIRPVIIAGRRYVVWVERDIAAIPMGPDKTSEYHALRVCFAYQQIDGNWSPANVLMQLDGHDAAGHFDEGKDKKGTQNKFLKTKKFQAGLMVMVNQLGGRENDPWLMVMLFDVEKVKDSKGNVNTSTWERDNEYFLIGKDLLLLDTKTLDKANSNDRTNEKTLVKNWIALFRDPRTVQHPYIGPRQIVEDQKSKPTWESSLGPIRHAPSISIDELKPNKKTQIHEKKHTIETSINPQYLGVYQYPEITLFNDALETVGTIKILELVHFGSSGFKGGPFFIHYSIHKTETIITNSAITGVEITIESAELSGNSTSITVFDSASDSYNSPALRNHTSGEITFHCPRPNTYNTLNLPITLKTSYDLSHQTSAKLQLINITPTPATLTATVSPTAETLATLQQPLSIADLNILKEYSLTDLESALTSPPHLDNLDRIKRSILSVRYTSNPDSEEPPKDVSKRSAGRISVHAAITRAQHAGQLDAVSTYIAMEKSAILAEVHTPLDPSLLQLLNSLIRLRHFHPEACVRILLRFGPEHPPVFTDEVPLDGQSTIAFQLPISRDRAISSYSFDFELYYLANRLKTTLTYNVVDDADDAVDSVHIRRNAEQALYLDLSEVNQADPDNALSVDYLRLNTLFGKRLVAEATQSVTQVLSWPTQHLPEPRLEPGGTSSTVDFRGANGMYFWELFFHAPLLIAWLLRQNRDYRGAWQWCTGHLFDPYRTWRTDQDTPQYWLSKPIRDDHGAYRQIAETDDPDLIAYAEPERYRKALHLFVVENWQREGDELYRQLTLATLEAAAQCYDKALRLIGLLPEHLSSAPADAPTLAQATPDQFTPPLNNKLVELRNLLRNRLFNLRHGLSLDGKPVPIMLDPDFLERLAQGHTSAREGQVAKLKPPQVPPCRYDQARTFAREAVEQLIGMGQTLLGYYQTEATQQLELLSKRNLIKLLDFPYQLQQQALELAKRERETLITSKAMVQQRLDYYQELNDVGVKSLEESALSHWTDSYNTRIAAAPFYYLTSAMSFIPTIGGTAVGGWSPEEAPEAVANLIESVSELLETKANTFDKRAEFQLRAKQWQYEAGQATLELTVLDKQLRERDVQLKAARIALQEAHATRAAHQAEYEVMTSVFPSRTTYLWLIGRLSQIYATAYDATLSLCLMAESCLQYELGDFTSTWIKPGAWLDNWRGMLAGEALARDLMLMDLSAIRENHRPLDIRAELSLVNDLGLTKEQLHQQLLKEIPIQFSLAPHHFDKHFPGHYMRRIERIFLTFTYSPKTKPTSPSGMLYQTANRVLLKDDSDGANYLYGVEGGSLNNVLLNLNPNQKIAIWSPKETFPNYDLQPSIPDKSRYQPFEGTGLLSSWRLEFPRGAKNNSSLFVDDTCTLEDISVHIIYSALDGSADFRKHVKTLLQKTGVNVVDTPAPTKNPSGTTKNPSGTTENPPGTTDNGQKASDDAVDPSLAAQGLEIQRRASALAEAMTADLEAAAWSQAAQDDANADALKATEAADQLTTANTAVTEAQTAASKAKAAREKADNATTADDAEKAANKAKSAADDAKAAAKKAAAARKAAEDADRLKKDQEADLITKKIAYLEKNMNKEIRITRWTGNGNVYYNRGTLINIDKKNNTFTLKSEVYDESYTFPITDAPVN
ncbi:neuraminidase-like domain-containing protein [Pseudomonas sp. DCB_AW]|uniref:Tc toxin subunit A-related protein n=1 Tax=Pseudomonas sp. DCB_AW TaxID=2993596 RepID=UPI0022493855|nr:neuraminidase-like domain-containing protein [Pseudomonas sp. DCB_AW]MCX2684956.1 neuraminidase-like domain-containing protein [Pseudomonas sp. DCB_AW]